MPANPPTITWDAPNDHDSAITGYTVTAIHKTDTVTYPECSCTSTTLSCTFATELPDSSSHYKFAVTATNAVGTSEPSATDAPNVPRRPPQSRAMARRPSASQHRSKARTRAATPLPRVPRVTVHDHCSSHIVRCDWSDQRDPYTFTAVATNWVDSSPASVASDAVTLARYLRRAGARTTRHRVHRRPTRSSFPLPNGPTYNFYVSWGDGTTDHITSYNQAQTTHIRPAWYQGHLDHRD